VPISDPNKKHKQTINQLGPNLQEPFLVPLFALSSLSPSLLSSFKRTVNFDLLQTPPNHPVDDSLPTDVAAKHMQKQCIQTIHRVHLCHCANERKFAHRVPTLHCNLIALIAHLIAIVEMSVTAGQKIHLTKPKTVSSAQPICLLLPTPARPSEDTNRSSKTNCFYSWQHRYFSLVDGMALFRFAGQSKATPR
jgi:hypothetical protein